MNRSDIRFVSSVLRYELNRYRGSLKYYRDGDGATKASAADSITFIEGRIQELTDALEALQEAKTSA